MTSEGRTVVMCTHLLIEAEGLADQIVVLDSGSIVETGTHDELFAARGRYRALWDSGRSMAGAGTEAAVTEGSHR